MKIEQLLVQHLYNSKQVSLQGIGILKLKYDAVLHTENDKDFSMPADAFSFEYNLKANEDAALVDYIVQHTNKIKPLASSDLDSYAILAKQFLNLGKPFVIEGVGTLQKNQRGIYEFMPGQFVSPKIDDIPKQFKEKKEEPVSFESETTTNNSSRNLTIFLSVAGATLVGLVLYYFIVLKPTEPSNIVEDTIIKKLPANADIIKNDTLDKSIIDSSNKITMATPENIKTDGSSFTIVLKEYSSQSGAQKAFNRLTSYGHKLEIIKVDSLRYKLVMPFTVPLSDTLRVKDSIKTFFGGKPYIQL